MGFNLGFKGLN